MAGPLLFDRVLETSTTTGTSTLTLRGAASGHVTFDSGLATADTCYYEIELGGPYEWEVGLGTFTAPDQLARTTILASSNAGLAVNFSAGVKRVSMKVPAAKSVFLDASGNLTLSGGLDILTGLVVGFASAPTADVIQLGDANFKLQLQGTATEIFHDANDYVSYARAADAWSWIIASTEEMQLAATGLWIANGLRVGFAGAPADDTIAIGDSNFKLDLGVTVGTDPALTFDSTDYLYYDRTNNQFLFRIGAANEVVIYSTGVMIPDGLRVGFSGTPTADLIELGDAQFYLNYNAGTPQLVFATNDYVYYDRTGNVFNWVIASTVELTLDASGLTVTDGLRVGFTGSPTATDRIEVADANAYWNVAATLVTFQGDTNDSLKYDRTNNLWQFFISNTNQFELSASGLNLGKGLSVGFIGTPVDDQVTIGDGTFYLNYNAGTPQLVFDSNDYIYYDRTGNVLNVVIGSTVVAHVQDTSGWQAASRRELKRDITALAGADGRYLMGLVRDLPLYHYIRKDDFEGKREYGVLADEAPLELLSGSDRWGISPVRWLGVVTGALQGTLRRLERLEERLGI